MGGHREYSIAEPPKGELLAMDLRSGRVLWRQKISEGTPVLGGPVVTGQRVYVLAADETLAVLDADSGKIIEQHRLNRPQGPEPGRMCVSGPLLARGLLYAATQTGGLRCLGGRREARGSRCVS